MKRLLLTGLATVVVSAVPAAAELAQSGNVIVDLDDIVRPGSTGEVPSGSSSSSRPIPASRPGLYLRGRPTTGTQRTPTPIPALGAPKTSATSGFARTSIRST